MTVENTPRRKNSIQELKSESGLGEWEKVLADFRKVDERARDNASEKENRSNQLRILTEYFEQHATALEELGLSDAEKRTVRAFRYIGGGERYFPSFSGGIWENRVLDSKGFIEALRKWREGWGVKDDEYIESYRGSLWKISTPSEYLDGSDRRVLSRSNDIGLLAIKLKSEK